MLWRRGGLAVVVVVMILALASAVGGCGGGGGTSASPAASTGGGKTVQSMTWAITHTVQSLDPGLVYDSGGNNDVTFAEADTVVRFDNSLALSPGLATAWEQTTPTTYVYTLRTDAKFWDGNPVTPADVAFSINRITDPQLASPLTSLTATADLKTVKVTGPNQITMYLNAPNPAARWLLATPVGQVVERKFVEQQGKAFGTAADKVMCSGPYRPVSYTKGSSTVLQAVDNYWDKDHQPQIKQVTFKEISDPATIIAGLRSGEITGTFDLDSRSAETLGSSDLAVNVQPGVQINYVSPNLLKGPFENAKVRRAFTLAIDRTGLATAVSGEAGQPLKGPVTPGIASYQQELFDSIYNSLDLPTSPDVAQAKSLMTESGTSGQTAEIGILASGTADTVSAALIQAGQSIGLNVKMVKLPPSAYFPENFSGKLPRTYDALVNFWAPDFADPASELIPPFASRFSDVEGFEKTAMWPAYKALEAKWRVSQNGSADQANILGDMENQLINDTVKIPLYVDPLVQIHSKSIGGYTQTKLYYYQPWLLYMSGM
jgi:peptide/nickel transport system substrate-binding protein